MKTVAGKPMPVDPGRRLLRVGSGVDALVTDDGRTVRGTDLGPWSHPWVSEGHVAGRVPHWSTCSAAGRFKR